MDTILHLATADAWTRAQNSGFLRAASLDSEGFLHCCTAHQLDGVVNRYYRGRDDLWLLEIDAAALTAHLRWEAPAPPGDVPRASPASPEERFPHVYAVVPLVAIVAARPYRTIP